MTTSAGDDHHHPAPAAADADLLAFALETARDGVVVLQAERGADGRVDAFRVRHVNDRAHALLPTLRAGGLLADPLPWPVRQVVIRLSDIVERGTTSETTRPIPTATGERLVRSVAVPSGDVVVLHLADVTDAHRDRDELAAATGPPTAGAGRSGSFAYDARTGTVTYSAAAAQLMGLGPGPWSGPGAASWQLVHPDDRARLRESLRAIDVTGTWGVDFRVADPVRAEVVLRSEGVAEGSADGAPVRLVGVVRDVTRERELANRIRHTQRLEMLGHLASGIAHDFNNLLSVIVSGSELALDAAAPEDRIVLEAVLDAAVRAGELSRRLLAFGRAQELRIQPVRLTSHVEALVPLLGRLVRPGVALDPRLGPPATVRIDPVQFDQVVMNLVVNASDAMPDGGTVVVSTKPPTPRQPPGSAIGDAHWVELAVSDQGAGMDDTTRRRAFDPFFTTKTAGHGTGLGLATVYGVVSQHGGDVAIESTVGAGTTVRIWLPVVPDDEAG